MFLIARATGWSEETILWMPLKKALQYVHAAWVSEGLTTDWRSAAEETAAERELLYQRLKYLTYSMLEICVHGKLMTVT